MRGSWPKSLAKIRGIAIDPRGVETNIVIFDVAGTGLPTAEWSARLKSKGVLINGINSREMRIVTHYDVDREGCRCAMAAIEQVAAEAAAGRPVSSGTASRPGSGAS